MHGKSFLIQNEECLGNRKKFWDSLTVSTWWISKKRRGGDAALAAMSYLQRSFYSIRVGLCLVQLMQMTKQWKQLM